MSSQATAKERFQGLWAKYSTLAILVLIFILFSAMAL